MSVIDIIATHASCIQVPSCHVYEGDMDSHTNRLASVVPPLSPIPSAFTSNMPASHQARRAVDSKQSYLPRYSCLPLDDGLTVFCGLTAVAADQHDFTSRQYPLWSAESRQYHSLDLCKRARRPSRRVSKYPPQRRRWLRAGQHETPPSPPTSLCSHHLMNAAPT